MAAMLRRSFSVGLRTARAPVRSVRCMSSQTTDRTTGKKKTTQLREMIQSKDLEFIMEAHNGLSAKIVQEAGFKVGC